MQLLRLVLFELFAIALFWSCFCRSSHTHKGNTLRAVRWAFTLLGLVSMVCIVLPPLYGYEPDGVDVMLLSAMAVTQLVTAHYWRAGVPEPFQRRDSP